MTFVPSIFPTHPLQTHQQPVLNATQVSSDTTHVAASEPIVRRCSACGTQNPFVKYFGNTYDIKCSECLRGSGDLEE
jgi:hypothetical protein